MISNLHLDFYGPTLEEYLNCSTPACQLQLTARRRLPSREDILDAIQLLSEPDKVTYQTFETILALEFSPVCINLDLLVSDAAQASLPACFHLIEKYRKKINGRILDHAYGLLCLRVTSLLVQFAIISQSDNLNALFASNTFRSQGQSIALDFNNFTSGLMFRVITQHLYNRALTHKFEAFGWATDPDTGAIQCLPMLGGCTVITIHNLLGVLWDSRDQLLYAASQTQALFPGFGGLLCWIWSGIVQQVDCGETPASELQSIWAQFVDILIRFTLCSNECEAQLASRLYVACDKFGDVPTVHLRTKNTVNDRDSARIGIETARKLGSDPGLSLDLTTALVAYSGPNINFSGYIIDIMEVAIERLCIELDDVHQPADLAGNLIAHCEMCFFTLSKITEHDPRGLIRLFDLIGEELFEALGRIVLLPLSISGLHTIATRVAWYLPGFVRDLARETSKMYAQTSTVPSDKLVMAAIPIWYKVFWYFVNRAHYNNRSTRELEHLSTWVNAWISFGDLIDVQGLYSHVIRCGQRCQSADWKLSTNPHMSECGKPTRVIES
ncbi:unnamed protein product [Rhizoctonia solani]|uniref:Uncharacterized protein n=1 Tax=Rhizoctonia solani TaxID=456999 RepID=A0A8H3C3M3_9AGAM|nr:unnamed protein product [Rhizoctonia solani]